MNIVEQSDGNHQNFNNDIWRIPTGQKILWRKWEGDYLIFSSLSSETHILDIASGKVLELIVSGSSTSEDIRSEIGDFLKVNNDAGLAQAVDGILSRLEDAGLIEPVI